MAGLLCLVAGWAPLLLLVGRHCCCWCDQPLLVWLVPAGHLSSFAKAAGLGCHFQLLLGAVPKYFSWRLEPLYAPMVRRHCSTACHGFRQGWLRLHQYLLAVLALWRQLLLAWPLLVALLLAWPLLLVRQLASLFL